MLNIIDNNGMIIWAISAILWTFYAVRMQHRLYGKHTELHHYLLIACANLLLWPLAMLICAIICPIKEEKGSMPTHGVSRY